MSENLMATERRRKISCQLCILCQLDLLIFSILQKSQMSGEKVSQIYFKKSELFPRGCAQSRDRQSERRRDVETDVDR